MPKDKVASAHVNPLGMNLEDSNVYLKKGCRTLKHTRYHYVDSSALWISKKTYTRFLSAIDHNQDTKASISLTRFEENLLHLLPKIDVLKSKHDTLWIGIDGFSGSGKTTLANLLGQIYDANVFHTDDFFKKPTINTSDNVSIYGSNIDFSAINHTVIDRVRRKEDVLYASFDFKHHIHRPAITHPYKRINVFEGAYVLHPYLKQAFDLNVFYTVHPLNQATRIIKRSGMKRFKAFITTWIPNEKKYVKHLNIKEKCDIVLKS